jgi:hypothetical protein
MTPEQFATLHRVDPRTVQRWCKDGEIPGAVKTSRGWQLPADAMRITPLPGTDMAPTRRDSVAVVADTPTRRDDVGDTLEGALSVLSAWLTLEQASPLLGISVSAIRKTREVHEVQLIGGRLMMPARAVRAIAGLTRS